MIRQHVQSLTEALPNLPGQFSRAWLILTFEFEAIGILGILTLILGLVAAGLALDRLARYALRRYIKWMVALPAAKSASL